MNSLQEKDAIRDLHYLYAFNIDTFNIDAWVDCFTEDGIFDESEHGYGVHVGHDNIRAYGQMLKETAEILVHIMANHLISFERDDLATGTSFAIVEVKYRSGERIRSHCTYTDTYSKVDGKWKIAKRHVGKTFDPEPVVS